MAFLMGALLSLACSGWVDPYQDEPPIHPFVSALNATGLDMLRTAWTSKPANVVYSPVGAGVCLTVCLQGADEGVGAGLRKALHLDDQSLPEVIAGCRELTKALGGGPTAIRAAVWLREPMRHGAPDIPADVLRLASEPATIVEEANQWASAATGGLVDKVLSRVSPRTSFLVTSACGFQATWKDRPTLLAGERGLLFRPLDGDPKRVDSLFWHGQVAYSTSNDMSAVSLPYHEDRYGLLVVVPAEGHSVGDVLGSLTAESIIELRRTMRQQPMSVTLPKFAVGTSADLVSFLETHGAELACAPGNRFPLFAQGAHLTQVAHATVIEVDERGTRAASATAAVGGGFGGGTSFNVDRPFLFFVHDVKTGSILFDGICAKP